MFASTQKHIVDDILNHMRLEEEETLVKNSDPRPGAPRPEKGQGRSPRDKQSPRSSEGSAALAPDELVS